VRATPRELWFNPHATSGSNWVTRSWGDENIRPQMRIPADGMEQPQQLVPWQLLLHVRMRVCAMRLTETGSSSILEDSSKNLQQPNRLVSVVQNQQHPGCLNR